MRLLVVAALTVTALAAPLTEQQQVVGWAQADTREGFVLQHIWFDANKHQACFEWNGEAESVDVLTHAWTYYRPNGVIENSKGGVTVLSSHYEPSCNVWRGLDIRTGKRLSYLTPRVAVDLLAPKK